MRVGKVREPCIEHERTHSIRDVQVGTDNAWDLRSVWQSDVAGDEAVPEAGGDEFRRLREGGYIGGKGIRVETLGGSKNRYWRGVVIASFECDDPTDAIDLVSGEGLSCSSYVVL
ncbi:hypothetical protein GALL_539440 [mine drainage metagenome]|uniref:Uncharacterized protein n=1 Tax=mine drainage metagenome TaxID=410659 RepID=A0A1J5NZ23_9ZZZZ